MCERNNHMSERKKLNASAQVEQLGSVKYISSGSTMLDLALGGGWALGRVANLVGDRSSGKTLLAIEMLANMFTKYGGEHLYYGETEAAFDETYAENIGMPRGVNISDELRTIEDFFADLKESYESIPKGGVGAYVLDSLDALSDDAELKRDMDEGSYGTAKARKLSEAFRRGVRDVGNAGCLLMVISQIRDKIGVTFGETKTRSGGRALDFYASQIVWLVELGKRKKTVRGVERVIGIDVRARVRKNKVGTPHREAEFPIIFGYGVDDEMSMIEWLGKMKALSEVTGEADAKKATTALLSMRKAVDQEGIRQLRKGLRRQCKTVWQELEEAVRPPARIRD